MNRTHYKKVTALTLVVTLVLCQSFVTGTPLSQVVSKVSNYLSGRASLAPIRSNAKLPRAANLSVKGTVTLNGMTASDGATVFSGAGVQTKDDSSAILSFGKMGQVELTSASDFTLAVEGTTLGGQLRSGRATIVAPAGVAVKIETADGPVVADGREATHLTIDVTAGKTRVETSNSRAGTTAAAGDEGVTDAPAGATAQAGTQKSLEQLRQAAREASEQAEIASQKAWAAEKTEKNAAERRMFDALGKALLDAGGFALAAANAETAAAANAAALRAAEAVKAVEVALKVAADNINIGVSRSRNSVTDAARAARAARAVADALTLAEAKAAEDKAKADAGNGGGGPTLKDTVSTLAAVVGVGLGIATLEEVKKNNNVSPMTPGTGS